MRWKSCLDDRLLEIVNIWLKSTSSCFSLIKYGYIEGVLSLCIKTITYILSWKGMIIT